MSIVVLLFVSGVYIYITANCTSVTLRVYQSLEQYRSRYRRTVARTRCPFARALRGQPVCVCVSLACGSVTLVDSFLRRNKVRSSLRRLVRQHFKQEFLEGQAMTDDTLLRQMPQGCACQHRQASWPPHAKHAPQ